MHSLFLFFDYFSFFIFFTIYFFKLFILLYFLFVLLSYYFSFNAFSWHFKRIQLVLFISNSFLKMTLVCLLFLLLFCFQYLKNGPKKIKINPSMKVVPKVFRWFLRSWIAMLHLCDGVELFVLVLVHVVWNNNTQQCYQHLDLNWYQDSC